jgi:hypothetical protein
MGATVGFDRFHPNISNPCRADEPELTRINFRRTLLQMPTAFDQAFRQVKELVADFRANEKFHLFPAYGTCQTP